MGLRLGTRIGIMMIVIAFTVAGCSQRRQIDLDSLETLPNPVLIWASDNTLCGATRAVDGDRSVWRESGCENGPIQLDNTGTAGQSTYNELLSLYESFPEPRASPPADCQDQVRQSFSRISPADNKSWLFCTNPQDYDDPSGLEDPFLSAAEIFNQLP